MKHLSILASLFVFFGLIAHAQIRFEVEAPSSVDINEPYFQIRYRINTAETSQLTSPSFTGFSLLAGPSISTKRQFTSVNGHNSANSSTTFTYTLAPQKKGSLTIPPASIQTGGKTYHSRAVRIQVTGNGQRQPSSSPSAQSPQTESLRAAGSRVTENDLYLTADIKRNPVYEQEAVLVTYRFHERPGVGLNNISLNKKPDFKGLISQDIPIKEINATVENINGKSYRTGVVQQYLIFPQHAGKITIPGITFNCTVIQRDHSIDLYDAFFNGGGNVSKSLNRTVPEHTLTVKPLPAPRPAGFSGGVGQFSLKGELLSTELRTNEPSTYRITVSGNGNLKLINAPDFRLSPDFEPYTPKTTDKTEVTKEGISGSMIFDYTFMPRKTGEYDLPSVNFIYFDPQSGKYETKTIPARHVTVKKGERSEEDAERELQLRGSDIRDIKQSSGNHRPHREPNWWNTIPYWSCFIGLIVTAILITSILRRIVRRHTDLASYKQSKAGRTAARKLRQAEALLRANNQSGFYTEISHALHGYASDKYGIEMAELSMARITAEMSKRGIPSELQEAFAKTMDECELLRFAPQAPGNPPEAFHASVVRMLNSLEEASDKRKK